MSSDDPGEREVIFYSLVRWPIGPLDKVMVIKIEVPTTNMTAAAADNIATLSPLTCSGLVAAGRGHRDKWFPADEVEIGNLMPLLLLRNDHRSSCGAN